MLLRLVGPVQLGDVAGEARCSDDPAGGGVAHRRDGYGHLDDAAVLMAADGLVMPDSFPAGDAGADAEFFGPLVLVFGDDNVDGPADRFLRRVAVHAGGRVVPGEDDAAQVYGDDRVVGVVHDRREVLVGLKELAFRDIAGEARGRNDPAGGVAHG